MQTKVFLNYINKITSIELVIFSGLYFCSSYSKHSAILSLNMSSVNPYQKVKNRVIFIIKNFSKGLWGANGRLKAL